MEQQVGEPMMEQGPVPEPPRTKRRWPWIVGIIVAVLLVLGAGSYLVVTKLIGGVQQSSSQVAEHILGPLRDGQQERLRTEAAPLFREQVSEAQWNNVLAQLKQTFGRPLSWKLSGVAGKAFVGPNGPMKSTTYSFKVTCEKGSANVDITVDGEGKLLGLYFKPA